MQPKQLCVAPSANSFCAALKKLSFGQLVLFWDLWESSLQERGGVLGADEQELGMHGREEGPLQGLQEAGR